MAALLIGMVGAAGGGEPTSEPAAAEPATAAETMKSGESPTLLFVQGKLKEGAEPIYQRYLAGTQPLMAEYGVEVEWVGSGVESEHTTESWPVNAVLRFPSRESAEQFLSDPRYLEIKAAYRDKAYETLHLSLVAARPPIVETPREVAEAAFADLRHGLASGEWQPFLDRLSDDFTFHFPLGRYQGLNRGKEKAEEFFQFVSQAYPDGLDVYEVVGVTAEDTRVVFEFRDRGELRGAPYENLVAISLDVCGDTICGYREYFGLVGPPPGGDG